MEFDPSIDVILMTAHYSTESAVEAIKKGATDYLNKPISIATLRERVGKLLDEARRRHHALRLEDELLASSEFEGIIGRSPLMWNLFSQIRRVAPHYRSLLVTGQTGTGKDLVAQAIHRLSPAHLGRYVVLNCSAVVETLFESELFGHVRGSFTGATADKPGLFEHAHGGTLFLDEIGDMPLATQAKLLRVLQNQEVQRVGSLSTRKVDVRVIAATNHDLRAAIRDKLFREDLYYRLSMVELHVPTLAERERGSAAAGTPFHREIRGAVSEGDSRADASRADPAGAALLAGQRARTGKRAGSRGMMTLGDTIDVQDLPAYLHQPSVHVTGEPESVPSIERGGTLEEQERVLIVRALEASGGNQSQAARILRIGRDALRYKLKKHGLDPAHSERGTTTAE